MRQQNPWPFASALAFFTLSACRGEPAPSLAPSAPPPAPAAAGPAASASATASQSAPPATAPSASSAAPEPSAVQVETEPSLVGPDGAPLPQTEERPVVDSERFKRRMQLLADAILTGDSERARSTFFPLLAYSQVKDVQKPERDYRYRLLAHFDRDVREYHKALGKDAERAQFLGVDVPEDRAQWMKPGKEGNRFGYYRVLRSRLRFRLASGADKTFELTSMISWRGEWYVVHLHGFE